MISVNDLSKTYTRSGNSFTALQAISFQVPEGSTLAITGKSGSGKSTLMHIMSGLDRPTTGSVTIGDVNLYDMKANAIDNFRANQMSFIFQSFFVEANQSCYRNVLLPLEIAKVPLGKRAKLVRAALQAVELDSKESALAGTLSGGQKQRLAIARAIVRTPKILFADEPTGNLDSTTGDKIMDLLFNLNKRLGCTIILVTHDLDLAKRCKLQLSLKDGALVSFSGQAATTVKARQQSPTRIRKVQL